MLAVTLLAFGIGVYALVSHTQHRDLDRSLLDRAGALRQNVEHQCAAFKINLPSQASSDQSNGPRPVSVCISTFPTRLAAQPDWPARALKLDASLGDPSILEQVNDSSGASIYTSPNLDGQTIPAPADPRHQHLETVHIATGRGDLRVLVWPINAVYISTPAPGAPGGARSTPPPGSAAPTAGTPAAANVVDVVGGADGTTPAYTLLLARSLNDVNGGLSRLEVAMAIGALACLATAAAAGWLLARNALLPMDRLTAEAQRIGRRQDFSRRVRHSGPSDEVGRLAGTFNTMLDSLEEAYDRQQRALEAQKRFVADASHELRTPLTTIRGNVDLLRLDDAALTADQREALDDVASEAERMSRLVANLLELARADGGLRISRVPVDIQPVIDEVLARSARRAHGIDLTEEGRVDALVLADRDYLVQLLTILLDNALKYTPDGGVVTVRSAFAGDQLRIAVNDTGPGIRPEQQAHVFDRFYRADASRHGEGTGLGLAIARWIARELGGEITLQSDPDHGSTFTVLLPASGADTPTAKEPVADGVTA